ncbi:hypothetical protein ASZ90_015460 [hydrocarbon metagenome]|uniref:Uncharacterized protein n=1 Tax=hydrocarbon metagenome TaxID=938273 RepID=A0A0W8F2T2_9ZZZZ
MRKGIRLSPRLPGGHGIPIDRFFQLAGELRDSLKGILAMRAIFCP